MTKCKSALTGFVVILGLASTQCVASDPKIFRFDGGVSQVAPLFWSSDNGRYIAGDVTDAKGQHGLEVLDLDKYEMRHLGLNDDTHIAFIEKGEMIGLLGWRDQKLRILQSENLQPSLRQAELHGYAFGSRVYMEYPTVVDEVSARVSLFDLDIGKILEVPQKVHKTEIPLVALSLNNRLITSGWVTNDGSDTKRIVTNIFSLPDLTLLAEYKSGKFDEHFLPSPLRPRLIGRKTLAILGPEDKWIAIDIKTGNTIREVGYEGRIPGIPKNAELFFGPQRVDNLCSLPNEEDLLWFTAPSQGGERRTILHARIGQKYEEFPVSNLPLTLASLVQTPAGELRIYCGFSKTPPDERASEVRIVPVDLVTGAIGPERQFSGEAEDKWLLVRDQLIQVQQMQIKVHQLSN